MIQLLIHIKPMDTPTVGQTCKLWHVLDFPEGYYHWISTWTNFWSLKIITVELEDLPSGVVILTFQVKQWLQKHVKHWLQKHAKQWSCCYIYPWLITNLHVFYLLIANYWKYAYELYINIYNYSHYFR